MKKYLLSRSRLSAIAVAGVLTILLTVSGGAADASHRRNPCPVSPGQEVNKLNPGERLLPGESLVNCDIDNRTGLTGLELVHQSDGNVVAKDNGRVYWSTGTAGTSTRDLVMKEDGNLVLYGTDGKVKWQSKTAGNPGVVLVWENIVYDNGDLLLRIPPRDGFKWRTLKVIVPGVREPLIPFPF